MKVITQPSSMAWDRGGQRSTPRSANHGWERRLEERKRFRAKHRERLRAEKQAYYQANKDRILAHKRAYYAANRERINAARRARYAAAKGTA